MKTVACILVLLSLSVDLLTAGPQPRLVVDNRTNSAASVQVWRYNGAHWDWVEVGTVAPRHWIPIYDIREGDRFRAVGYGSAVPTHVVKFYFDRAYGGPQDIWLLQ